MIRAYIFKIELNVLVNLVKEDPPDTEMRTKKLAESSMYSIRKMLLFCTQSLSVKVIIYISSIRNIDLNVHYEVRAE